jgi:hypothetical protein
MKVQNISNSKLTNSDTAKQNQYRNRNKQSTIDFNKLVDIEFNKLTNFKGDNQIDKKDNKL